MKKVFIGIIDGVRMFRHYWNSPFDGEPQSCVGPEELGPIDPSAPVIWKNFAAIYPAQPEGSSHGKA